VRRFRDQAALRTGPGNLCSGSARSRRQASSSPFRRAASSAAKASTPCGDQLIPWCLQRADTAQSLYFSTRVLAIHIHLGEALNRFTEDELAIAINQVIGHYRRAFGQEQGKVIERLIDKAFIGEH
jgi:hypothetical protein